MSIRFPISEGRDVQACDRSQVNMCLTVQFFTTTVEHEGGASVFCC